MVLVEIFRDLIVGCWKIWCRRNKIILQGQLSLQSCKFSFKDEMGLVALRVKLQIKFLVITLYVILSSLVF